MIKKEVEDPTSMVSSPSEANTEEGEDNPPSLIVMIKDEEDHPFSISEITNPRLD